MKYGGVMCREVFIVIIHQSQPSNSSLCGRDGRGKKGSLSFLCLLFLGHSASVDVSELLKASLSK